MFRMNGMARCQGWQGAAMFRMNGMTRCQGWQGAAMFRRNGQDFCSQQILSTYVHVSNDAVPAM